MGETFQSVHVKDTKKKIKPHRLEIGVLVRHLGKHQLFPGLDSIFAYHKLLVSVLYPM